MAKETPNDKIVKLTAEGKEKLEAELLQLRTVTRKEIAEKIKEARSYGDLSENSEYDEAKDEQAKIEARIAEIEQTLKVAVIIEEDMSGDKIRHGSVIKVAIGNDKTEKLIEIVNSYDVVNDGAATTDRILVSEDSPMGAALIGKKAGAKVSFEAPVGEVKVKIIEIVK